MLRLTRKRHPIHSLAKDFSPVAIDESSKYMRILENEYSEIQALNSNKLSPSRVDCEGTASTVQSCEGHSGVLILAAFIAEIRWLRAQ